MLATLALLLLAGAARGQDADPWQPPEPSRTDLDWVRLNSGEWVGGDIERIVDDELFIDSEELDDQEIDLSDIAEMRSARRHTYRFSGRRIYTGTMRMREGKIRIHTGTQVLEFERRELVSMIEGDATELNYWSFLATAGLTAKRGNTDTTDLSGRIRIERETALTSWRNEYNTYFSDTGGDETANNHRLNSEFKLFFTRRLFAETPSFEFFRDRFQNIDLRITTGLGAGYELFKTSRLLWDVTLGAAHQHTQYNTVAAGDSRSDEDVAALLSTSLETDLHENIEWDTSYRVQLIATDLNKTNHNLQSVLSFDIWGPLDLDVSFVFDRIEKPRRDTDGNRPKSNDVRMTVGLSFDL